MLVYPKRAERNVTLFRYFHTLVMAGGPKLGPAMLVSLLVLHLSSTTAAATENSAAPFSGPGIPDDLFALSSDDYSLFGHSNNWDLAPPADQKKDSHDYELYLDAGYIYLLAIGMCGMLYFAPEGVSQWEPDEKTLSAGDLAGRYWNNISGGPVIDSDKLWINLIGHPYFGSVYYIRARHRNKTPEQALAYSFIMSTFVYENGIEAFFEKPSLQDIIITPLFGSLLGEIVLKLEKLLHNQDDKLFNSRTLGAVCLFFIDPLSRIVDPMKEYFENYLNLRVKKEYSWFSPELREDYYYYADDESIRELVYGVKISFYRACR